MKHGPSVNASTLALLLTTLDLCLIGCAQPDATRRAGILAQHFDPLWYPRRGLPSDRDYNGLE